MHACGGWAHPHVGSPCPARDALPLIERGPGSGFSLSACRPLTPAFNSEMMKSGPKMMKPQHSRCLQVASNEDLRARGGAERVKFFTNLLKYQRHQSIYFTAAHSHILTLGRSHELIYISKSKIIVYKQRAHGTTQHAVHRYC